MTHPLLDDDPAVEDLLAAVTDHMGRVLDHASGPLRDITREHLATGGRQFRARVSLAAATALGVPAARVVPFAAACDLLHNATLVHDDLQDGDRMRRGEPALWVRHGAAQAINAGDLLLMAPFLALESPDYPAQLRWALTRALARRASRTACGQAMELTLLSGRRFTWDVWASAARGKTGALCALPVEGAALVAGLTHEEAQRLGDAAEAVGVLFQARDDVLDLYGEKGRERPGNDLREGKVSALVAAHLERRPSDVTEVVGLLETPRHETTDERVSELSARFVSSGALREVARRMRDQVEAVGADPTLGRRPELRRVLLGVADILVEPVEELSTALTPGVDGARLGGEA